MNTSNAVIGDALRILWPVFDGLFSIDIKSRNNYNVLNKEASAYRRGSSGRMVLIWKRQDHDKLPVPFLGKCEAIDRCHCDQS
jgi:hypothetical protein